MRLDELELSAPLVTDLHPSAIMCPDVASCPPAPRLAGIFRAWRFHALLGSIIAAGILLRLFLPSGFTGIGFDENLYRNYIAALDKVGLQEYPALIDGFVADQLNPHHQAILPPTRLVYIVGGYFYHHILGLAPLDALRTLSCQFSILTLLVSAVFCWRLTRQRAFTAAVTALMACAPTQLHLGQHALIDGVFGFWALLVIWLLWENLKQPDSIRWQVSYAVALAIIVMTKENAFFVFAAVVGILACNRWLTLGCVTRSLVLTTFAGAMAGFAVVVIAAGGVEQFALVFELLKQKVPILPYTIHTGGGPWHRYLVDLVLVSPVIAVLAVANLLQARGRSDSAQRYLAAFSCLSYVALTAFPDGMNLRYVVMLDMPLRFLAAAQLFALSAKWAQQRKVLLACAVLALCAYDLRQHRVLFIKGGLYELVTEGLVRAQGIVK
jgi:4-amino-4-deoxy-L-arabinose transferase-like glycosyltransferase